MPGEALQIATLAAAPTKCLTPSKSSARTAA